MVCSIHNRERSSRWDCFTCSTLPYARRAASLASSGDMPRRSKSSARRVRCDATSRARSSSARLLARRLRSLATILLKCTMLRFLRQQLFKHIKSALVEIQSVVRDLLAPVGDAISMPRAHGGKSAKDDELERTLQNLDGHFLHLAFK